MYTAAKTHQQAM